MVSVSSHESESQDEGSDGSFELPDALATGREKRATAGNRLRDMLNAELETDAIFAEDEEDKDFDSEQDLQDDLNSELDSASSDDQHAAEPDDIGERDLIHQERDLAKIRKRKAGEAFRNQQSIPKSGSQHKTMEGVTVQPMRKLKPKHISHADRQLQIKRQSSRAHAVEIAGAVNKRLTEDAVRRLKSTKVARVDDQPMTQQERLEEAKITEAKNVASLTKIVQYEEDKKTTQKMLSARNKRSLGPCIRYVSSSRSLAAKDISVSADEHVPIVAPQSLTSQQALITLKHPMDQVVEDKARPIDSCDNYSKTDLATPPREVQHVTTFLTIENLADDDAKKKAKVELLFGSLAKRRQAPKKVPVCSLSGLRAIYRDPATNIPYGNAHAYAMLQRLKTGEVPWNPQLKMYVPQSTQD